VRERKIENKVAKSVVREMSIGEENYARSIIPIRSDISMFSRGTGAGPPVDLAGFISDGASPPMRGAPS